MGDPAKFLQLVDKYANKAPGKVRKVWNVVTKVGTVATTVYTVATPVRKADGSIDYEATALRYYKAARSATARTNVPEFRENEEKTGVQVIDNGDGTITFVAPMWLHDP